MQKTITKTVSLPFSRRDSPGNRLSIRQTHGLSTSLKTHIKAFY